MPLEQFQTQVLLLHSEQSTLDSLSSGFDERYSVHCVTSGIEALNTLGVTPIDVIVSAQDLPGMSGIDALREAKKRSPETITILMAGANANDGLEALVSDQAVYQIVRGEVSPAALFELVENATKAARLVALSESANDKSAAVDSGSDVPPFDEMADTGEHIVMETGDNGSCIISDGTGQFPSLKPEKIAAESRKSGQQVDVLVFSQDEEFLQTVRNATRGMHKVHHAVKPGQAEELVRKYSVGILVTDAALAGSSVEAMTQRLRSMQRRLVAIVAGRRDDGEMLMDLINRGQVYRFLLKPVSPGRARLAIEASVKHHLEAPEHSFEGRPGPKKITVPPPRPSAAGQPAPKAKRTGDVPTPPPKPAPAAVPTPPPTKPTTPSATDTGVLDDAFDEGPSFTETMTGIAVSVGKTLTSAASSLKGGRGGEDSADQQAPVNGPQPVSTPKTEVPKPEAPKPPAPQPVVAKPEVAQPVQTPETPEPAAAPTALDELADVAEELKETSPSLMATSSTRLGTTTPPPPPVDEGSRNPLIMGAAAAALLAVGIGAYFVFGGGDEPAPAPAVSRDDPAVETAPAVERPQASPTVAATNASAEALLAEAREARQRGDIFTSDGDNAIELYLAAMLQAPGDADIGAELDATVNEAYGLAEAALLENRTGDAERALTMIGLADAGNQRLNFLNAQLDQQRLRRALDDARAAIRESRFEDAGRELALAESFAAGNTAEIDALSAELSAARSDQQLDEVLAMAAERLQSNRLLSPANDNARYYFELAASIDPNSAVARQGLSAVASKLVLQARSAIDAGDFNAAESLLDDARDLDRGSDEVGAAVTALANARQAVRDRAAAAEQERQRQAAAEQERQRRAAAEAEAERQRQAAAELERQQQAEAERQRAAAAEAERQRALEEARAADSEAARPAIAAAQAADSEPEPTTESPAADAQASSAPEIVSITRLTRTKYVPPQYPRAAQRRNQSGYVDVVFTVTENGAVGDVEIRDSTPGNTFVNSAINAVKEWEFEPVVEGGEAVSKRVAVRLSFNLQ